MGIYTRLYLSVAFLFHFSFYAQTPAVIKIRSTDQSFYFYQAGTASDTISPGKHDLFYMNISAARRCHLKIETENGFLAKTNSDTIFQLKRVSNMNYVHYYGDTLRYDVHDGRTIKSCDHYSVATNGTTQPGNPNIVYIRFYDPDNDNLLFINKFYYK